MPTIKQLPAATAVGGTDLIPVSQGGLTRGVTVSALLGNTQPLLSLAQGTLLGRVSIGVGGPEAVSIGTGLSLQSGTVISTGQDHLSLPLATSLLAGDEIVINSGAVPRRLVATQLRSLFSAGSGIQIDNQGLISTTGSSSSGGSSAAGPKGDTGAQGAPGQGFAFRGPWQPGVIYNAYDVVTSGGQSYVATSTIPAAATFSATSWSLIAAQGSAGAQGSVGATGPGGPTIAATASAIGAIKPGTGLTVAADGTLSIGNVALASIAQGGATVGQLMGWSGTGWTPTTPAAGVSYTGSSPITVASGVISLNQSGAAIGQVLTWTSTGWGPATPATVMNYSGMSPITVTSGVISLSQSGAATGQVLTWTGSDWMPQAPTAPGAAVGTATPLVDGLASTGTLATASREDHRHPTDTSRAPLSAPIFTQSITLPVWTTTTRPVAPTVGMEGYASDTAQRETYTPSGWVQYARVADLPAASGQLLAGSGVAGKVSAISVGSGLSLTGTTLSAVVTTTPMSGISIDGSTIVASNASPYQMMSGDRVVDVNKSSGKPTQVILPASPTLWVDYTIIDGKGDAATNNITLSGGSGTTINGQSTFIMNANNDAITLRAISSTVWRIT